MNSGQNIWTDDQLEWYCTQNMDPVSVSVVRYRVTEATSNYFKQRSGLKTILAQPLYSIIVGLFFLFLSVH